MEYEQVVQCSRAYKYGENEEFKTREEAEEAIQKLRQKIVTTLALKKIYELSEVKLHDVNNAMLLVVVTKVPKIFKDEIKSE